jgi:hypothetical protein
MTCLLLLIYSRIMYYRFLIAKYLKFILVRNTIYKFF